MNRMSETAARQLLAQKSQLVRSRDFHAKRNAELGIVYPGQLEGFDTEILEIDTEIVRRAMRYEDSVATLPGYMIESGGFGIRACTVTELMTYRNDAVSDLAGLGSAESEFGEEYRRNIKAIDGEVERRALEVEDFHAKVCHGFMSRIQAA